MFEKITHLSPETTQYVTPPPPNSMLFASLQGHPDIGLSLTSNK